MNRTALYVRMFVVLLALPALALAQPITIDDFSTNQASLALTFPPAGTTASSSVSGSGILGGERDLQVNLTSGVIAGNTLSGVVSSGFLSYSQDATIAGSGTVQWDGTDGSPTLNPTGLGGIDLTAGGTQDAFVLRTIFDDLPVSVTIEVFTGAGNASSLTLALPGLIFSDADFVVPYSSFTTSLGSGATFSNVGAIRMTFGSGVTAPDLVFDFLRTTSTVSGVLSVAIQTDVNGNSQADPCDTLRYTAIVSNPDDSFDAAATSVVYSSAAPANTTLVVGSVTTSMGTVTTGNTAGDTSVAVAIGTLADGANATVTYDVAIACPLAGGVTEIVGQGTVSSPTLTGLPTNPAPIPVVGTPALSATIVAVLATDANANSQFDPGDKVLYTVTVTNSGNAGATGVSVSVPFDPNTGFVPGSIVPSQGTITSGNGPGDGSVGVDIGAIPGGGGSATVVYCVTIDNPLPDGVTQISAQGTVTATGVTPFVTNDPGTGAPGDPTVTPIQVAGVAEVPTLDQWGLLLLAFALLALGLKRLRRQAA
jgi:uncharacterized repeat protein (TIGR01451 family)